MKKKITLLSLVLALGMSGSLPVYAADAAPAAVPSTELIQKITEDRLTLLKTFEGPGDLTGYVMQPKQGGSPIILYAQKQGAYAVYGTLIGPDGANLSEQDQEKYVTSYVADLIAAQLNTVSTFSEGSADAPYQLYVLADPSCSACHYFYQNAKKQISDGQLRIQWILVGFVQPDSLAQAATIMHDKDPAKAMTENESGFDSQHEKGGAKAMKDIPKDLQAKLDANMAFMHATGLSKTPTLMFYGKDGKLVFIEGAPRDMAAFLKESTPKVTK